MNIIKRPINGIAWTVDTARSANGNYAGRIEVSSYDHHGSVIGGNIGENGGIYVPQANNRWQELSTPVPWPGRATAVGGDAGGNLIASFNSSSTPGTFPNTFWGTFCTSDMGATWHKISELDSIWVYSFQTFGDTTYILSSIGIFKKTCDDIAADLTSIAVNSDLIKIYPNPAKNECHIYSTSMLSEGSVCIIQDVTGRSIRTISLSGQETTFTTDGIATGFYSCTILSQGKIVEVKKLLIAK